MDPVNCPDCGTPNSPFAEFCDGCFRTNDSPPPAPLRVMPPPPPPPPTFASPVPAFAGVPSFAPAPMPVDVAAIVHLRPSRSDVRWRWWHLGLFGLCAWGVPGLLSSRVSLDRSLSEMLDATLLLQLLGYLLALLAAAVLVARAQGGDWGSLGLTFSAVSADEVARGMGFGSLLLLAYLPVGLALNGGHLASDPLVGVLIGSTSGTGLMLAGVILLLGAPIVEEIYYRGMLYEKIARNRPVTAIVVTSLLFVSAHGAVIIPALLLLAFGLGIKRRTHGLWYTISAHGAWNFGVLLIAAFVATSPATEFVAADGAYSLHHPRSWERVAELESLAGPWGSVDIAVQAPDGSFFLVERFTVAKGSSHDALPQLLDQMQRENVLGITPEGPPKVSRFSFVPSSSAYEVRGVINSPPGVPAHSRMVAVLPPGSSSAFVFDFVCPEPACESAEKKFENLLASVQFPP
jgi:uncharacterized protein